MIVEIQKELDDLLAMVKLDLSNPALLKLRPDLYREYIHILEKKEMMARSSVSSYKDTLLALSLQRFH